MEIEPLQQNSPLHGFVRGKLGMLRQAVDALPKRSHRRLGGMVIGWSWILEIPFLEVLRNAVSIVFGERDPRIQAERKKNSDEKRFRESEAYDIHTRNETNLISCLGMFRVYKPL